MTRSSHHLEPTPAAFVSDPEHGIARCSGAWTIDNLSALEAPVARWVSEPPRPWQLECGELTALDSAGAWLLQRSRKRLQNAGATVTIAGLRPEQAALLELISAQPAVAAKPSPKLSRLEAIGKGTVAAARQGFWFLAFVGEVAAALKQDIMKPRRWRGRELLLNLQLSGFNALPIVGLLSFLMGVVIAYQGAAQLVRYGANIFIADLVGLSILRELAPLMTAIIVAGRSGSAYTAQIGTMTVTEEVDALRTLGIAPIDLLVLPKLLALMLALPLLTVYSDIMGVMGGMVVAKTQLGVGFSDFLDRFADAVKLSSYLVGLGKAPVFAALIALVGCFQGFQVSGGADSVGRQTTLSVVQGIFLVIVADAAFSVAFSRLGL